MYTSIVKVEENRVVKYAEFLTQEDAEAHSSAHGGFVHPGEYRPELWVEGETVTVVPLQSLQDLAANRIAQIDADVDSIYAAAIGNRGPEYMDAETAAQAYKDAGYHGAVPPGVQSWADAKGWTAQQAADDILAAALQLNTAKLAIRAERLLRKEQIRTAADAEAINTIMASWAAFVVQTKAQLGLA